ncbi:MAG: GNAT family N-acetyltransferase [Candidatus Vogelbacteria bacterium]|nr:GNAT family N-acetyltransferase [Candidatus Vogelbacteria bacterium]
MTIREFRESDRKVAEEIFALYWTDPEFLKELSDELGENARFFVAEDSNEIVGIVGFKKLPDYLKPFALTNNPVEFYVIAAKYKRRGIGEKLKLKLIEEVQKAGFTEILLFSPNTHNESWNFHDKLGFERVGEVTPPEDNISQVWRKVL